MSTCQNIAARVLYNSRGHPNIEIEMQTVCGMFRSFATSQLTCRDYDCVELHDGDKVFGVRSVNRALDVFRTKVKQALSNLDITDARKVDEKLVEVDDSSDRRMGSIGTNVSLPISQCAVQAAAAYFRVPLFRHIQKLMGQPDVDQGVKCPAICFGLLSCSDNCPRYFREVYVVSKQPNLSIVAQVRNFTAVKNAFAAAVGSAAPPTYSETGAYVVDQENIEEVLGAVNGAIQASGADMSVIIDVAAGDIVNSEGFKYNLAGMSPGKKENWVDGQALCDKLCSWTQLLPVSAFIDPFSYFDLGNYQDMRPKIGDIRLFGQQLFSSHTERIEAINGAHRG